MTGALAIAGGPFHLVTDHRTGISQALGGIGLAVALLVLAHRLARRVGGWYVVRRRARRELRLTAAAFAAPVRRWLAYRRQLRLLSRALADPAVWAAGEQAMRAAHEAARGRSRPYAVVVGADLVGVHMAAAAMPRPPAPWTADEGDAHLWWSVRESRHDPAPAQPAPPVLLVALGLDGDRVVFADWCQGPAATALYGDEPTTAALLQALAAQLERRLPAGAVVVADGVHPRHSGPPAQQALRDVAAFRDAHAGTPAFAVCAEPPAALLAPGGPPVLLRGRAQGRARLLSAALGDALVVHGSPLRPQATALPRAVARAIDALPPYRPPARTAATPEPGPPAAAAALGRSATSSTAPRPEPSAQAAAATGAVAAPAAGTGVSAAASAALPAPEPAPARAPAGPAPAGQPVPGPAPGPG